MLFNINSWADARAALQTFLPTLSALAVTYGVLDENQAGMWVALAASVLGPGISAFMTPSTAKTRTALYAVLGAGQALLIGYGIVQEAQVETWLPVLSMLIGGTAGGVSVANIDTTPAYGLGGGNLDGTNNDE